MTAAIVSSGLVADSVSVIVYPSAARRTQKIVKISYRRLFKGLGWQAKAKPRRPARACAWCMPVVVSRQLCTGLWTCAHFSAAAAFAFFLGSHAAFPIGAAAHLAVRVFRHHETSFAIFVLAAVAARLAALGIFATACHQ